MGTREASSGFLFSLLTPEGIDPLFFGFVYFLSIPLFIASMALLLRNIHTGRPVLAPSTLSVVFLIGSYIYLSSSGTLFPPLAYIAVSVLLAIVTGFVMMIIRSQKGYSPRKKPFRRRFRN